MPRYFFDFRDGAEIFTDNEGTELADDNAARREATETVTRVAHDAFPPRLNATEEIAMMVYREDRSQFLSITLILSTSHRDQQG